MTRRERQIFKAVQDRARSWGERVEISENDTGIQGFIVKDCNGNIDNIYLTLGELANKYSVICSGD